MVRGLEGSLESGFFLRVFCLAKATKSLDLKVALEMEGRSVRMAGWFDWSDGRSLVEGMLLARG